MYGQQQFCFRMGCREPLVIRQFVLEPTGLESCLHTVACWVCKGQGTLVLRLAARGFQRQCGCRHIVLVPLGRLYWHGQCTGLLPLWQARCTLQLGARACQHVQLQQWLEGWQHMGSWWLRTGSWGGKYSTGGNCHGGQHRGVEEGAVKVGECW